MVDNLIVWIYAAGIVQAVFLAASLLTLKFNNQKAAYALIAMILIMAIALTEQLADTTGAPVELALSLALEFGLAPLLYIFVRSIAEPQWKTERPTAIHFAPLLVAFAAVLWMHAANEAGNLGVFHPQFGNVIIVWVIVKMIYFAGYGAFTEKALRRSISTAKPAKAEALKWIYRWLMLVFATVGISYFTFLLFVSGVNIWRDSDVYSGLAVFVVIFSIAYVILSNRKILDYAPPKSAPQTAAAQQAAEQINAYVLAARPHKEPDFSLEQLAAQAGLTVDAAQAGVAQLSGGGFSDYVNRLRLEEFDALARDPQNKSKTTLELAFAAGFNSKATFYRVFNAEKATTPSAFRKNLKSV